MVCTVIAAPGMSSLKQKHLEIGPNCYPDFCDIGTYPYHDPLNDRPIVLGLGTWQITIRTLTIQMNTDDTLYHTLKIHPMAPVLPPNPTTAREP